MGQQQLLLIVLGVIIVGIAIVVGINLFSASSLEANRDALVADNMNLAALAQQYYKKPTELGGGNNSFVGFTIPTNLVSTANGTYALSGAAIGTITITGTGLVLDANSKKYKAVTTVTPAGIATAVPTLQ